MTTSDTSNPAPPKKWEKAQQWAYVALAAVFMFIGFIKVYNFFFPSLPGCTSDSARDILIAIFKPQNVEFTALTNQRTLTDSSTEKTCKADFKTRDMAGTLSYRIFWQDKQARVEARVDTQ